VVRLADIVRGPRRVRRLAHIARKSATHGLGFLVSALDIQGYLPAWMRVPLGKSKPAEPSELPSRLAKVLEELGPTFVKFGQMLASRPDILPSQYISELNRICHHVAPFPGKVASSIVEKETGRPAEEVFASFSEEPRASGSIAQIHDAELHDGTPVVVKLRRPGIEKTIEDDLAIMEFLAAQANNIEDFRPLRLPLLVDEFGRGIRRELDLLNEAAHTHRFWSDFEGEERLVVPRVYWDYTTEAMLTLQRISGAHMTDFEEVGLTKDQKAHLARLILDLFLQQFFVNGRFHADPHPGNVVVLSADRIALIDFGLVGRLGEALRNQLILFIVALGNEQLDLAADILCEIGGVGFAASKDEFHEQIVAMLERYYSMPVEKIHVQRGFLEVMRIIRRHDVNVPRGFVLLGKAMVSIGGMVLRLDPELNVAAVARPYGRRLLRDKISPTGMKRSLTAGSYHVLNLVRTAPRELLSIIRKLRSGLFEFTIRHEGFEKALSELDRAGNRLALSIILAAIIIASSTLMGAEIGPTISVLGEEMSVLGLLGFMFGSVLGVWLVIGIFRSGRL